MAVHTRMPLAAGLTAILVSEAVLLLFALSSTHDARIAAPIACVVFIVGVTALLLQGLRRQARDIGESERKLWLSALESTVLPAACYATATVGQANDVLHLPYATFAAMSCLFPTRTRRAQGALFAYATAHLCALFIVAALQAAIPLAAPRSSSTYSSAILVRLVGLLSRGNWSGATERALLALRINLVLAVCVLSLLTWRSRSPIQAVDTTTPRPRSELLPYSATKFATVTRFVLAAACTGCAWPGFAGSASAIGVLYIVVAVALVLMTRRQVILSRLLLALAVSDLVLGYGLGVVCASVGDNRLDGACGGEGKIGYALRAAGISAFGARSMDHVRAAWARPAVILILAKLHTHFISTATTTTTTTSSASEAAPQQPLTAPTSSHPAIPKTSTWIKWLASRVHLITHILALIFACTNPSLLGVFVVGCLVSHMSLLLPSPSTRRAVTHIALHISYVIACASFLVFGYVISIPAVDDVFDTLSDTQRAWLHFGLGAISPSSVVSAAILLLAIALERDTANWQERVGDSLVQFGGWLNEPCGPLVGQVSLLAAALYLINVPSLLFFVIACLGLSGGASRRVRGLIWIYGITPVTSGVLLWQYAMLVGPPPHGHRDDTTSEMIRWLGLSKPTSSEMLCYGIVLIANALVSRYAYETLIADVVRDQSEVMDESTLRQPLLGETGDVETGAAAVEPSSPSSSAVSDHPTSLSTPTSSVIAAAAAAAYKSSTIAGPILEMLGVSELEHWHARLCVHTMDLSLIGTFWLGSLSEDLIHLGYLWYALYFFRHREALLRRMNFLFWHVRVYNALVLGMQLAFQAPFPASRPWVAQLTHVIGLYRLKPHGRGGTFTFATAAPLPDLALFVLFTIQASFFRSKVYRLALDKCQQVGRRRHRQQEALRRKAWLHLCYAKSVTQAVIADEREARIEALKRSAEEWTTEHMANKPNPDSSHDDLSADEMGEIRSNLSRMSKAEEQLLSERQFDTDVTASEEIAAIAEESATAATPPPVTPGSPIHSDLDDTSSEQSVQSATRLKDTAFAHLANTWDINPETVMCLIFVCIAYIASYGVFQMAIFLLICFRGMLLPASLKFWTSLLMAVEALIIVNYALRIFCHIDIVNPGSDAPGLPNTPSGMCYQHRWLSDLLGFCGIGEDGAFFLQLHIFTLFLLYLSLLRKRFVLLKSTAVADQTPEHGIRLTDSLRRIVPRRILASVRDSLLAPWINLSRVWHYVMSNRRACPPYFVSVVFDIPTNDDSDSTQAREACDAFKTAVSVQSGLEITLLRAPERYWSKGSQIQQQEEEEEDARPIALDREVFSRMIGHTLLGEEKTSTRTGITDSVEPSEKPSLVIPGEGGTSERPYVRYHAAFHVPFPPIVDQPRNQVHLEPHVFAAKNIWRYFGPEADASSLDDIGGGGVVAVQVRPYASHPLDIYPLTVTCDAICLIYLLFTYQGIVKSDKTTVGVDFAEALNQEQFPLYYINALAVSFALILFDRIAYVLRDHRFKAVHLFISSVLFVGAMCWIQWVVHRETYSSVASSAGGSPDDDGGVLRGEYSPVQPLGPSPRDGDLNSPIWQTRRWLLLFWLAPVRLTGQLLHALQLRMGYPNTTAGQYLTRSDGSKWYWNTLWGLYRAVPFLYEMRTILDWSCSSTALTLREWLKLEDIYASLFTAKCLAIYNRIRVKGRPQPWWKKLFLGFGAFALLIVVLWAPPYIFSTGNPTVLINPVRAVQLNITLERQLPASFPRNTSVEEDRWRLYEAGYSRRWIGPHTMDIALDPPSLAGFPDEQLQALCIASASDVDWPISAPNVEALRQFLNLALTAVPAPIVQLSYGWTFVRDRPAANRYVALTQTMPLLRSEVNEILVAVDKVFNATSAALQQRRQLPMTRQGRLRSLVHNETIKMLPAGVSFYARLPGEGAPFNVQGRATHTEAYCNLTLSSYMTGVMGEFVWSAECYYPGNEDRGASYFDNICPESGPALVVASDKVLGGILASALTGIGLVGIYVTFVLGIGRFLRLTVANMRVYIPFEDLPDVTRIVTLIEGIYAARSERLFALEEELYGALIRLYRSPELLIAATEPVYHHSKHA